MYARYYHMLLSLRSIKWWLWTQQETKSLSLAFIIFVKFAMFFLTNTLKESTLYSIKDLEILRPRACWPKILNLKMRKWHNNTELSFYRASNNYVFSRFTNSFLYYSALYFCIQDYHAAPVMQGWVDEWMSDVWAAWNNIHPSGDTLSPFCAKCL